MAKLLSRTELSGPDDRRLARNRRGFLLLAEAMDPWADADDPGTAAEAMISVLGVYLEDPEGGFRLEDVARAAGELRNIARAALAGEPEIER